MKWGKVFRILFWIQAGVNLVGALGPELSFDALWYHLPISRLVAERGWWGTLPGELLYPSGMPRLMDYVNAGLLWMGSTLGMTSPEIMPKLLVWVMGLLCARMIYVIARKYGDEQIGYAAVVLWYTTLLVGWQSIVVYVDLARTLFVLLAVRYWLEMSWWKSSMMMAVAYSIKFMSITDAMLLAIVGALWQKNWRVLLPYGACVGLAIGLWGGLNIISGYSFLYPFFEVVTSAEKFVLSWKTLLGPLREFLLPGARIGPVIFILAGIAIRGLRKQKPLYPFVLVTTALVLARWIWLQDAYGRYFLPALALLSILASFSVSQLVSMPIYRWGRNIALGLILFQAVIGIGYRAAANAKFVPVLLRYESKSDFLTEHLNFTFGDWYDVDGWVGENLAHVEYSVKGVHNTYYLPGDSWKHESFADSRKCYSHVLIQGEGEAPLDATLIHEVARTTTRVYEVNCF